MGTPAVHFFCGTEWKWMHLFGIPDTGSVMIAAPGPPKPIVTSPKAVKRFALGMPVVPPPRPTPAAAGSCR